MNETSSLKDQEQYDILQPPTVEGRNKTKGKSKSYKETTKRERHEKTNLFCFAVLAFLTSSLLLHMLFFFFLQIRILSPTATDSQSSHSVSS
jgi:hypothetical protein